MARVKQDLRVVLDRAGFSERVGDDLIFPTLPTALAAYRAFAATSRLTAARRLTAAEAPDGSGRNPVG